MEDTGTLPYVFDLIWDLKTKDDLLEALESPGCDEDMIYMAIEYGYINKDLPAKELSPSEMAVVAKMRAKGFAVVVISPEELGQVPAKSVEDRLTSLYNEIIAAAAA